MISQQVDLEQGEFYRKEGGTIVQQYVEHLGKYFGTIQKVQTPKRFEEHLIMQRVIYCAILKEKSHKYQIGQVTMQSLARQFDQVSNYVKHEYQMSSADIMRNLQIIPQVVLPNFPHVNKLTPHQDEYLCNVIKAICRKQKKGFIHSLFSSKKPQEYSTKQMEKIAYHFNQQTVFLDFDQSSSFPDKFAYNSDISYVLKIKHHYYLLYPISVHNSRIKSGNSKIQSGNNKIVQQIPAEQKKEVKIIKKDVVKSEDLDKIFLKQQNQPQNTSQVKYPNLGDEQSRINAMKYFPQTVQCHECNNKFAQFDCLKWNYLYFCEGCLISPHVNTSSIPGHNMEKYFRQRNLEFHSYKISCPECEGQTILKNYNPTRKPRSYTCLVCQKKICMQHLCMIFTCFCICTKCTTATVHVPHLHLNVCPDCHDKLCLRCCQKGKKFCKCICAFCLQDKKADHACEPKCHNCHGKTPGLRQCKCGMSVCPGCYYFFLDRQGQTETFCLISDFV